MKKDDNYLQNSDKKNMWIGKSLNWLFEGFFSLKGGRNVRLSSRLSSRYILDILLSFGWLVVGRAY